MFLRSNRRVFAGPGSVRRSPDQVQIQPCLWRHYGWQTELDIRTLKTTLKMDCLRCKTPFMVEKEIWGHLLGYNLVRKVAAQAAQMLEVTPRSISFSATKQAILGGW